MSHDLRRLMILDRTELNRILKCRNQDCLVGLLVVFTTHSGNHLSMVYTISQHLSTIIIFEHLIWRV